MENEECTLQDALNRLYEHTQYFIPSGDGWALDMAMDALQEKIDLEKEV